MKRTYKGHIATSGIYARGEVFPRERVTDWSNVPKNKPSKRVTHINKWTHDYELTNGYCVTLTLEDFLVS
jgi:hypothetical protein